MMERVQCLLLVESGSGQGTRSSRNSSSSSASVLALLPRIFKDTRPDVIKFFKNNNIQIMDSACTSGSRFHSTARTKKLDILELQLTFTNVKPGVKKLVINVRESDKEIARLLLSGSIGQIRISYDYEEWESFSAIDEENVRLIQDSLAHGVEFSYRSYKDKTVLHLAAKEGSLALVKSLLKHGYVVDALDSSRWTPLHVAASKGNYRIVKTLIEHGANVSTRTERVQQRPIGNTPLLLAADSGHLKVVKFLLQKGADINVVNHSDEFPECVNHSVTPLHLAVKEGHFQSVELLVQHGARVDVRVEDFIFMCPCPLMAAAEEGHSKVVKFLLDSGADVHGVHFVESTDGETALHVAAEYGRLEIAAVLLKGGASINARTKKGVTPLLIAAQRGHTEVVKLLLEAGADINVVYDSTRSRHCSRIYTKEKNILIVALEIENQDLFDMVLSRRSDLCDDLILRAFYFSICRVSFFCKKNTEFLFPPPFTIDSESLQNINETKLLFGAIHKNRPDIVEQLLKKGVNVNSLHQPCGTLLRKISPLYWATFVEEERMIELLLKSGADVNAVYDNKLSLVNFAITQRNMNILKLLIKYKANICTLETIHAAIKESNEDNLEFVEVLLQNGANPDYALISSGTPAAIAVAQGCLRLLKLLLDFGASIHVQISEKEKQKEVTLLHCALVSKEPEIFRFLLDYSFNDVSYLRNLIYLVVNEAQNFAHDLCCHAMKLLAAGKPLVNLEQLFALGKISEDFHTCCEAEIFLMKNEKLEGTDVLWYDVLTKDIDCVAAYVRNDCIVQTFETGKYRNKFPIYASVIEYQFKKGRNRRDFITSGIRVFSFLFKPFVELPDDLKEKIVSLLNNRELQMLRCI